MFAFIRRTFLILLGLFLLTVFIWFAGPFFAFASYRPLESEFARLVAIGVIVGSWILFRLVKRWRASGKSSQLLAAVVAQRQPEPQRPSAEAVKLRERFEEAVSTLKQQHAGHSLYKLPWYVIIGAPGSGKTTALLNSGLTFPLEQRVGKGALRGVGGTRNCDWWFTGEAVFLDTAGRYLTQDSDEASDSAGWREFLALLKKYRTRRPINGILLTINGPDLLVRGGTDREAHVEAARRRLDELKRELGIQLPVYVMVTKCDLVAGFSEYFDDLTAEGRSQVWGVTFPYDQTLANEGPQVYADEFDALMTRLNERVFARIEEVRDPRRRTKVFAFPQQMSAMRDALTEFVSDVFASSRFDRQILLRGVYFTSGTQDGTPIDRLLGSIGRRFGTGAAVAAPVGPGKAYFIQHLLKDLLIGESGLASVNRQLETRKAVALLSAYAAMGLVAVTGVVAMSWSYARNQNYLEQTAAEVGVLDQAPQVAAAAPIESTLPRLDAIRAIVDSSDRYRGETSWATRWGLYQGGSVGDSARDAYLRELDTVLLPRVAALIRTRLTQAGSEPERLYLYLKAYLMLGDPRRLDPAELQLLLDAEWRQIGVRSPGVAESLSRHLKVLLESGESLRPIPLDGTVVAQARSSLPRTAMARLVYAGLKRNYTSERGTALRIDQVAGLQPERVFKRRSGVPLSAPLPPFYSREAFKQITGSRESLVKLLAADAWLWGDNPISSIANAGNLASTVENLYEQDYIREWDALLDDLQFATFTSVPAISEALRLLTSPTSPLRGLLTMIADNTTLVDTTPAVAPKGVIAEKAKGLSEMFNTALRSAKDAAGMATVEPGTIVTAHFQWVRQITAGEPDKTQLDSIIRAIAAIQQQLATIGPDAAGAEPDKILSSPTFRGLVQTLRNETEMLPPGLRTLVSQITRQTEGSVQADATNQVEQQYEREVLTTCRNLIAGKYPFVASSSTDVSLEDFGKVFGYDGVFDHFFTTNLDRFVDSSRVPWSWRDGSLSPSRQLLDQFLAAQRIRDTFFPPGAKTPKLSFFVTMRDLDRDSIKFGLKVDGQQTEEKHSSPIKWPIDWPGPKPGTVEVGFEARFFDPYRTYGGSWGWFRLVDETRIGGPDQQGTELLVRSPLHSVRVTVEPSRVGSDPFGTDWRRFTCES